MSQEAQEARAYPGFRSMNPPSSGWDDSPPTLNSPVPIYLPGWREALWEQSILPKNPT